MKKKILEPVYFTDIRIKDNFWTKKTKTHQRNTLAICLEKCQETGRLDNFKKAAGEKEGKFEGIYFNDSDVYKVLEGVAYALMLEEDAELEKKADQIIADIAGAQEENGYLDTYFTLNAPEEKWTDMEKHEMYCGGHLMEAAVAYKQATGKGVLLEVACRLADHYDSVFGPGKEHWVPGHEEVELGLIKLYRETGEERYLRLAKWLLEERGHGYGKGEIWDKKEWGPAYCQDDKPVKDMSDVKGHAVRAMYLYAAMADIVILNEKEEEYLKALDRLWESVVGRNMYVTGGIGQTKDNEGFTQDYDLPNDTAYCETCASVGMIYWNWRMNMLHADARYADIVEQELYNGALAGVSLDGNRFFYVNPLETDGSHHRQEWYDCSCCPTQIARFIPSIGNYIYNKSDNNIWINQFIKSESEHVLEGGKVQIIQEGNYPWEGSMRFIIGATSLEDFNIFIRISKWVNSFNITINDKNTSDYILGKGYLKLTRSWKQGDQVSLTLDMPVKRVYSDPRVKNNLEKVALQRGPIVYCFEEVDNPGDFNDISISQEAIFSYEYDRELLDGVVKIKVHDGENTFTAVPYYSWDNREEGRMKVWVKERE